MKEIYIPLNRGDTGIIISKADDGIYCEFVNFNFIQATCTAEELKTFQEGIDKALLRLQGFEMMVEFEDRFGMLAKWAAKEWIRLKGTDLDSFTTFIRRVYDIQKLHTCLSQYILSKKK